jgi:transposase
MSTIPTSVTEEQFEQYIRPYLQTAKRGYECKIPLVKIFNLILYRLHTGCQWQQLPIEPHPTEPEKKKSVGKRSIITGANGMRQVVLNKFGNRV